MLPKCGYGKKIQKGINGELPVPCLRLALKLAEEKLSVTGFIKLYKKLEFKFLNSQSSLGNIIKENRIIEISTELISSFFLYISRKTNRVIRNEDNKKENFICVEQKTNRKTKKQHIKDFLLLRFGR